jgi:hypothetical protein
MEVADGQGSREDGVALPGKPDEAGVHNADDAPTQVSQALAEGGSGKATVATVALESLSPRYDASQHETYVRRLDEAILDGSNRNLALTGSYGTGKSSILNEFSKKHADRTLRLAISTLEPEATTSTLTNRIQKELVKQLLYSASPRTLRYSRFNRIASLSRWRALAEAAAAVVVLGAILLLVGVWPSLPDLQVGSTDVPQAVTWLVLGLLLTVVLMVLRVFTHDRLVTKVSGAGASITLSERTHTYFDEYLEEIAHYFEEEKYDIVAFEDLDRFGDPHIFEALRELNTLLNNTPQRKKGEPLRFVYAVRDSLFERLGNDAELTDDAAAAETVRANRTKFFDIVIPVVPFISHRNARELLSQLLDQAGITGIDRRLVELVSQHATDMRLLRNMRNEYLVFRERLLDGGNCAPGLTPTNLFALVAYKNIHMNDFEQISRRSSDLDRLYDFRRTLVRACVSERERSKRELINGRERRRSQGATAEDLGARLQACAHTAKVGVLRLANPGPFTWYDVDSASFTEENINSYEFWGVVARAQRVTVMLSPHASRGGTAIFDLNRRELELLFPEALEADRWREIDEQEFADELAELDRQVEFLRGADFDDLATAGEYFVDLDGSALTFQQAIDNTMKSDLARDLVKRGYLDRNFTLYSAQFYGHFTGVDVATFIVQSVQTNTMEIDYRFTSPEAVQNLLREAGEDFTKSVSAYNISVLDHLLAANDKRAEDVVDRIVSTPDEQASEFLSAYFTNGEQRQRLSAVLAQRGWHDIFTYLVAAADVPDDARVSLMDAALLAADAGAPYDLATPVREFIVHHYQEMKAFTDPHDTKVTDTTVSLIEQSHVKFPDLGGIDGDMCGRLVANRLYELTPSNLQVALHTNEDVSLDRALTNDSVYLYCLDNASKYLDVVNSHTGPPYAVCTPEALAAVLQDVAETWDDYDIERLLAQSSRQSTLTRLAEAPTSTWRQLANARLFAATLANVESYRAQIGQIDENLAALLVNAGAIEADESGDAAKSSLAVAVINASDTIVPAATRVALVNTLRIGQYLPLEELRPEEGQLLSLLLEHELVADDAASFLHFHEAGWTAVEPALLKSKHVEEFFDPELVNGMVASLFANPELADKFGRRVIANLDAYIPGDDDQSLKAAAHFALREGAPLSIDQVRRIAAAGLGARDVLRLLRAMVPPATAQDVVGALSELPEPYCSLTTRAKLNFEVPDDDDHRWAYQQVLSGAGLCTTQKKRNKPRYTVKLA